MPPPRPDAVDESEITSDVEASMPGGWATLLPWLELRGVVSFGGLSFEHLSSLASRLCVDDRATLELLAKTFGPGVDPVVSWALEQGATPTFTAPDSDAVRHRVRLLAVAAIVANDYFQPFPPANSSHFEVVFHRFTPGAESFSLEYRRRDGKTLSSGHRYDEVRFHRPQATFGSQRVLWDHDLLSALESCLDSHDAESKRIRQSAVAFAAANRMDDFSSAEAEVVWATTALEQLLGVSERSNDEGGITKAFVGRLVKALGHPYTTPGQRLMLQVWARELYDKRSEIHGKAARTDAWASGWHAMLATVAYGICLKATLVGVQRYELKPADEWHALAFPSRVAALRRARLPCPPSDAGPVWREARTKAAWRWARLGARARLRGAGDDA